MQTLKRLFTLSFIQPFAQSSYLHRASLVGLLFLGSSGMMAQTMPSLAQTSDFSVTQTSSTARQRQVQVFFPRFPQAGSDFTQVTPVLRSTTNSSVARFAIEQLLAGPTRAEQRQGLRPALSLRGSSNCGSDFTLRITAGVAQIRFCRQVVSAGVGDDARAKSAIDATLKQFSTVSQVIILNSDGSCFGDQSGENRCLSGL